MLDLFKVLYPLFKPWLPPGPAWVRRASSHTPQCAGEGVMSVPFLSGLSLPSLIRASPLQPNWHGAAVSSALGKGSNLWFQPVLRSPNHSATCCFKMLCFVKQFAPCSVIFKTRCWLSQTWVWNTGLWVGGRRSRRQGRATSKASAYIVVLKVCLSRYFSVISYITLSLCLLKFATVCSSRWASCLKENKSIPGLPLLPTSKMDTVLLQESKWGCNLGMKSDMLLII